MSIYSISKNDLPRFSALIAVIILMFITANKVAALPITTIDMSDHGVGPFDQNYFASQGVVFTEGDFVGYVQGDEALIFDRANGITGLFKSAAVKSISVDIAPWSQGTWSYRLSALNGLSEILASKSIVVTQDPGDPDHSGFGYFSIGLSGLKGVAGFNIYSTFIRSTSTSILGDNEAALASMSFSRVPEPTTIILFCTGMVVMILTRKKKKL